MTARPAPPLGRTMMQNLARPFGCPQGTEHALVSGGRIALPAFWYVVAKLMFSGRLNPASSPSAPGGAPFRAENWCKRVTLVTPVPAAPIFASHPVPSRDARSGLKSSCDRPVDDAHPMVRSKAVD